MDDDFDHARSSRGSKHNVSLLKELLNPFRIGACIVLRQCCDLLCVILILRLFLFHDPVFQACLRPPEDWSWGSISVFCGLPSGRSRTRNRFCFFTFPLMLMVCCSCQVYW